MNNIKKSLFTSLFYLEILAISGCSYRIGGIECIDLSDSKYASSIEQKADILSESGDELDRKKAIEAYGSIGKLEKMDSNILWLIKRDIYSGLNYANIGKKYHKIYEHNSK